MSRAPPGLIRQPTFADEYNDVATASFLEVFIAEAEKRCWLLFEASRQAERFGH